ncbi:MAG: preprotein translocase subunit SecA [Oscillospiraceae bacterium]|nr:preprotein translocase subunit SecA [Oscillospiraceae bacterium]
MGLLDKIFGTYSDRELKRIEPIKQQVLNLEDKYKAYTDAELRQQTANFKEQIANGKTLDEIMPEALAVCREAAARVLGKRAFPVQIIGAIVLHQGRIAEMKTGEGKTLTACLAAYLNALSGKGVHVVTVNDYLAKFQSEEMGRVYRFLGLSIGVILHSKTNEERREAYACDITYGTNNEFGFDYLRDNMVIYKKDKVQREHAFAIVDEVDSILIDEARTPLIISGKGDKSTDLYQKADRFAKGLRRNVVVEMQSKEDTDTTYDGDYVVDEKAHTAVLTKAGVLKAEQHFGVENLSDMENVTLLHHINQALKANGVMKRDINYVVKDGEVIIVDEFTGRLMYGRRYNDGLHQAIEAKEGVKIADESKTIATITFQNYFRLYKKLSGMTGTAVTEEDEFREIYNLDVVVIPTNRPMVRIDHPDIVFKTERAKFMAVIDQVVKCHEKGQPVLVGTVSIEKSELLSKLLKARKIEHQVLNAKHHEREALIVSQAGQLGAVTIATNMAGRGTDIMLGGNAEYLAKAELARLEYTDAEIYEITGFSETTDERITEGRKLYNELMQKFGAEISAKAQKVKEAGGLFIIGTERHESRRIDNQLRGRSGRQGDEGESRFYLSLQDDLMRLFGGDRITAMMNTMNIDEDMPIESKMLTGVLESSQRKVEARNFNIRKNVLNYDDVMNAQRETIYKERSMVLDGEDVHEHIIKMINGFCEASVETFLAGDEEDYWNFAGLREHFAGLFTLENNFEFTGADLTRLSKQDIVKMCQEAALKRYEEKEAELTPAVLRECERVALLQVVDTKWMQHIDDMDELKKGISLRSYASHDPVIAYRVEGYDMFDAMIESIREDTVRILYNVRLRKGEEVQRKQVLKAEATASDGSVSETRKNESKVGRNDLCPCGSGLKYKKCCGK